MNTTGYLGPRPDSRPRIFAHRGLVSKNSVQVVDENTLESFELALESGADFLETDIQITRDETPVLFHDSDLTRLLGKKTSINSLTLTELKQLRLPFGGRVPTLQEALTEFPQAKFNIDFKTISTESPGVEVIIKLNAFDRVLVSGFRESSRQRVLGLLPQKVASSPGSTKVLAAYLFAKSRLRANLSKEIADVQALQIPTKMYGVDFTNPSFVEAILEQGKEIHYWTINDPQEMKTLFALGAHGIVTDRCDIASQIFS